jgi:hypothetical protein
MNRQTMRTLGFRSHVLFTIAACGAVAAALGMPWCGVAPAQPSGFSGPMDDLLAAIGRAVGATDGASGRDALGGWASLLAALAALTALMALLCLVNALYGVAREGLRLAALATLGLVAWKVISHPQEELRHGALIATGAALVLVAAAFSVAAAPVRRRAAPRFGHPGVHVPPPPPPAYDSTGSTPPPSNQ